ncbi:hypothetical protein AALO_G00032560 [Alosa alosa]|uniref:PPM-type phosphatase domain-containing protein n=1 Tax=Alosa alosa TaxID=278164 RepID=A0AAV6HC91_9TELE|nr:hypothetical protein AALO_G00032560 [Alosa alosa]
MSGSGNEEKTFRRFLELFLREMRPPLQEDQPLPMRPLSDLISEDEVEGECIDLCLQHLCKYNCPFSLASGLARGTADAVLQSDLSGYQNSKPTEEGTEPFPQLDSVKVARLAFNKLFDTCYSWLKEFPYRRRAQPYYETSIHAIKNMRRKMEDKHVVIPEFNRLFNLQDQEEQVYRWTVMGRRHHAANHLHVNLVRQEMFRQDPAEALCRAFPNQSTTRQKSIMRAPALRYHWMRVIAQRRAARCTWARLEIPQDEKQRIEALGGCVIWFGTWRVNGSLSVSRAIALYLGGDADHTAAPLGSPEDYLILACDGFYDTVNPDEAGGIAELIALTENLGDTAMVALLSWWRATLTLGQADKYHRLS